jgi:hypothetical protein
MSDRNPGRDGEEEGATGMVQEEQRALKQNEVRGNRAAEQGDAPSAGERTIGDDEVVNRGERDLTSE